MKGNGHIVFPGNGKRIADELASFLVGHVETEGPHGGTQVGLPPVIAIGIISHGKIRAIIRVVVFKRLDALWCRVSVC